ncbi:YqjF family protein [Spongiactinospora sp. 9N601]|uniref:YqjF family protein n=1 Tax=Spongiactinospora sp. 9N601 TaxID=3375149 RepID=UPI0037A5BC67
MVSEPARPLPVMYQRWSWMTFAHWRYPAPVVQRLLPDGLTVETYLDDAWVGLAMFMMEGVRPPGLPAVPWLSRFPETNVRTYVRDRQGRSGIWFLSLDAARLPAVLGGRAGFGLPYYWSRMSVGTAGPRVRYRCRRYRPGPGGARGDAEIEMGEAYTEDEYDETSHFLIERYRLFTRMAGRLATATVEHPRWPLRHARLRGLGQSLLQAGGLPEPYGSPLLHASAGVPVRIGMLHR